MYLFPAKLRAEEAHNSAQNVKKGVEADGRKILLLPLDLMKEGNVQKAIDEHLKVHGRLDVLVNNASKQIMCKDIAELDVSPHTVYDTVHRSSSGRRLIIAGEH